MNPVMRQTTKKTRPQKIKQPAGTHSDLQDTIEALRGKKFPKLPKSLVAEILRIESENIDDRSEAMAKLGVLIENYLSKKD